MEDQNGECVLEKMLLSFDTRIHFEQGIGFQGQIKVKSLIYGTELKNVISLSDEMRENEFYFVII